MKTIAITIDDDTLERMARIGGRAGAMNRSALVREAVRQYVSRLERAADEEREASIMRRHRARLDKQAHAAVRMQAKP